MLLRQPAFEYQNRVATYQQHYHTHNHHQPSQLSYQHQQHQHQQLRRPRYPQSLDIDLDLNRLGIDLNLNLASSPATTPSSPAATTAATAIPYAPSHLGFAGPSASRRLPSPDDSPVSTSSCLSPPPELMPSHSWMLSAPNCSLPHQSKSSASRFHNRDSSISSLGSTGPASPFAHNVSTPQIAVTDPACDGAIYDFNPGCDDAQSLYQLTKSLNPSQSQLYSGYANANAYPGPVDHMASSSYPAAAAAAAAASGQRQPRQHRHNQPAHHMQRQGQGQGHSQPFSAAASSRPNTASVASGDSPATPAGGEPDDYDRRRGTAVYSNPPKLDRTITDAYADELYNPDFAMTSPSPSLQSQSQLQSPMPHLSASNDLFAQRLQAANSQRLGVSLSPASTSRGRSPFRQDANGGGFVAPSMHDYRSLTGPQAQFSPPPSTLQSRGHIKTEPTQHHMAAATTTAATTQTETIPATISPREAMLGFQEPDNEPNFVLLTSHDAMDFDASHLSKSVSPEQAANAGYSHAFHLMPGATAMPDNSIMIPQHYPFIPRQQQQPLAIDTSVAVAGPGSSSCYSSSPEEHHANSPQMTPQMMTPTTTTTSLRPPSADGQEGTYTCTYHGCSLRFESQTELQKHKREGHRQVHGPHSIRHKLDLNAVRFNSQAGPHRCDRINPSTNKPCHTVFSRPYDLTRHEDTIHNGRKRKTRCPICTEEKTFSRRDALTRHYRVCHPDMELRGRHRRRHLAAEAAEGTTTQ